MYFGIPLGLRNCQVSRFSGQEDYFPTNFVTFGLCLYKIYFSEIIKFIVDFLYFIQLGCNDTEVYQHGKDNIVQGETFSYMQRVCSPCDFSFWQSCQCCHIGLYKTCLLSCSSFTNWITIIMNNEPVGHMRKLLRSTCIFGHPSRDWGIPNKITSAEQLVFEQTVESRALWKWWDANYCNTIIQLYCYLVIFHYAVQTKTQKILIKQQPSSGPEENPQLRMETAISIMLAGWTAIHLTGSNRWIFIISETILCMGNQSTWRNKKSVPVLLSAPQIPYGLSWDWTASSIMRSWSSCDLWHELEWCIF